MQPIHKQPSKQATNQPNKQLLKYGIIQPTELVEYNSWKTDFPFQLKKWRYNLNKENKLVFQRSINATEHAVF